MQNFAAPKKRHLCNITMHNHTGLNASLTCSSTVNFSKSNMLSPFTSQLVKRSNIHVLVYRINAKYLSRDQAMCKHFNCDTTHFKTEFVTH